MEAIALGVCELLVSPLAVGGFEEIVWVVLLWGPRSRWERKTQGGAWCSHVCSLWGLLWVLSASHGVCVAKTTSSTS